MKKIISQTQGVQSPEYNPNSAASSGRHLSRLLPNSPYDMKLSYHAIKNMQKREISRESVFFIVRQGTLTLQDNGRIRCTLTEEPQHSPAPEDIRQALCYRDVIVIIAIDKTVVTVYWTEEKPKKYYGTFNEIRGRV